MRCSECLGEMKPHNGGFRCESCGRILDPQAAPTEIETQQIAFDPSMRPRKAWVRPATAAVLALAFGSMAGIWFYTNSTKRESTNTNPPDPASARAVATGISQLPASEIFLDSGEGLASRQSFQIPPGLSPFNIEGNGAPAIALVAASAGKEPIPVREEALLLRIGTDSDGISDTPLYLPPAGRLRAIVGMRDGSLLVASDQESGLLLQRIAADGQPLWSNTLSSHKAGPGRFALRASTGGALAVLPADDGQGLVAVFLDDTGSSLWSRRLAVSASEVFLETSTFDEFLVVMRDDEALSVVTLAPDGREVWSRRQLLAPGERPVSLALDALGAAYVLTAPQGRLLSYNSVGTPELDLAFGLPDDNRTCTLWPQSDGIRTVCQGREAVEISDFTRNGEPFGKVRLKTRTGLPELRFFPHKNLLAVWSGGDASTSVSIDLVSEEEPPPQQAPDTDEQTPSPERDTSAPLVAPPDEVIAPIEVTAGSDTAEPIPDDTTAPDPSGSDEAPLPAPASWVTLSCRFACASAEVPDAKFPMTASVELDANMQDSAREALIDQEWQNVCQNAGGIVAQTSPPDCTPE